MDAPVHMTAWRSTAEPRMKIKTTETTSRKEQQIPNGLDGPNLSEESPDSDDGSSSDDSEVCIINNYYRYLKKKLIAGNVSLDPRNYLKVFS